MPELKYIPLSKIRENTQQSLRKVDRTNQQFIALVGSIRIDGVTSAISVFPETRSDDDKQYTLIDGLQRFTAASEAGTGVKGDLGIVTSVRGDGTTFQEGVIPAQVFTDKKEVEILISQIMANAHRIDTKPVDFCDSLLQILSFHPTLTVAELAGRVGMSSQWIEQIMKLKNLTDEIKPLVNEGKISVSNAFALATLPKEEQPSWVDRAQTMTGQEFGALSGARSKEIKDAHKAGKAAKPEGFVATSHLRKKTELEDEARLGIQLQALIRDTLLIDDYPMTAAGRFDASVASACLALQWALHIDPKSVETQRASWEAKKAASEAQKVKLELEKSQKAQKEANDRLAAAREAANKAAASAPVLEPAMA